MKVSVLLLTYNEAINMPACLDALRWCDDVVVVDSGSTDGTVEMARSRGARVLQRPFDCFADQRNYGLDEGGLAHDWVLHLDADEIVTPAFREALEALCDDTAIDGYLVPSKTMFFGRWLRHAGMWPAYQVRLGHAKRLRFVQVGHGQREDTSPERVAPFTEPLEHNSFSHGLKAWLDKHVRYARDEAALLGNQISSACMGDLWTGDPTSRRRAAKALSGRLPLFLRPMARFFYVYVWRRGFLDGGAGFVYAFMLSVYEAMIAILAYEARVATRRAAGQTRAAP